MDIRPCQRSRKEGEQERLHGLNASIGCTELAGARQDNGIRQRVCQTRRKLWVRNHLPSSSASRDGAPMMMMRASFGDNMHLVPRALHPTAQKALLELGTAGRL